jgi:hypothetical protein
LAGLYVEDQDLLYAASLPFVRLIGAQSGQLAPFTAEDLGRCWRAMATQARDALSRVARARQISWSFDVVRGRATEVVIEAMQGAHLAGLGVDGHPQGRLRLGAVADAALAVGGVSLLLVPPQRRPGERWVALLDTPEGAAAVLRLARTLATTTAVPLLLVTPALAKTCNTAFADLPEQKRPPLHSFLVRPDLGDLLAMLRRARAHGLILAADSPFARPPEVERLLMEGGWPLLLVR